MPYLSNAAIKEWRGMFIKPNQPSARHSGRNFSFDISLQHVPFALIDNKLGLPVIPRVLVALCNSERRCIRDSKIERTYQVQDLALADQVVQTVHDLLDGSTEVPPVKIEDDHVSRTKLC